MLHQLQQWQVAGQPPVDTGRQMGGDNLTIADLVAQNAQYDAFKQDFEVPASDFQLEPEGGFSISGGENRFSLEDSALVQLAARLGQAFFGQSMNRDYTRALINKLPNLFAPIINSHAAEYGKNIFVRTYGDSVRAFMSDRFTHIDNADMLGILKDFLEDPKRNGGGYSLVRPYVGRDELNVRIMFRNVLPPGADGPYGIGCAVRTGEVGNLSPTVMPFIQRHACTNSTMWEEGGIKLKQSGNRANKLMLIIGAMGEALQATQELIQRMVKAQYEQLPSIDDLINSMAEANDWSTQVTFNVVHGTNNNPTLFGLVNGLTYAAHASELPAHEAVELELLGGKVLMGGAAAANR